MRTFPAGEVSEHINLASGVHRHARSTPDAEALRIAGRTWSYRGLRDAAAAVAERLSNAMDAPRVGVLASRSLETYAGILGAAWAGGSYVALHPKQPAARLASILGRAGLDAIVLDERGAQRVADPEVRAVLPGLVLSPDWFQEAPADASDRAPAAVGSEHPAYVMYTSGTTGVPKGVVVTAGNVAHFLAAVRVRYGIAGGDRVAQFAEASFDLSVFEIFAAWDGGACLSVVPETDLMAPAGFIRREQVTVWASVPSVVAMLARLRMLEPGMFPSLRASFFIGEALPVESARAWLAAAPASVVDNQYGPTEATVACTVQPVTEPIVETPARGTVSIGTPYEGMAAGIVADGRFLPAGQTGELALSGPQLAAGYLGDPELTARRFPILEHPSLGTGRWYLTGDLAFCDESGLLHWTGRTDHQVKIMGHRVELEDVEAHLRVASGAHAVAAVARPVPGGTTIAAFVCGSSRPASEIRERLRELVPPWMLPRQVIELDALPLSANGKVDRYALGAMLDELQSESASGR